MFKNVKLLLLVLLAALVERSLFGWATMTITGPVLLLQPDPCFSASSPQPRVGAELKGWG